MKPRVVADAPCHENIRMGDEIDLERIPSSHPCPKDGGPIITGGVIVSKEIDGTRQNLSCQRMHVKGKDKVQHHDQ
ncbi:MAG: UbiD family decarboxylase domain-containing protein [Enterocloster bolteae]